MKQLRLSIVSILLLGLAACASKEVDVDRGPANEIAQGGTMTDISASRRAVDGVSPWSPASADEYEAGRRRGKRKARAAAPKEESGGFGLFGQPFQKSSRQGKSAGRRGRRCPNLTSRIEAIAPGQSACYESLFTVESSCSTTVVHDRRATRNPHAGVGLCALETSPAVRAQNRRGPNCNDISSTDGQIRCCVHLMRSTNGRYFGTVLRGQTPRCR